MAVASQQVFSQSYLYTKPEMPYQLTQDNKQFLLPLDLLILNNSPVRVELNEMVQWTETRRYTTLKDNNNYITHFHESHLDIGSGGWATDLKYDYTNVNVDGNGNLIHYYFTYKSGSDSAYYETRNNYQAGVLTEHYQMANYWAFKNYFKTTYTYENNRLKETYLYYDDDSTGAFTLLNSSAYQYDGGGNVLAYVWLNWMQIGGYWDYENGKVYTYTPGNKVSSIRYLTGDSATWTNSQLDSFYYNSAGKVTQFRRYTWDANANGWVRAKYFDYTYNSNQTLDEIIIGSGGPSAWVMTEKIKIEYDAMNKPTIGNAYLKSGNSWATTPQSRILFNGYSPSAAVHQQVAPTIAVYPNPAGNYLTVSSSLHAGFSASVYNVMGKKVSGTEVVSTSISTLDISTLPKGLYFLHLRADGETHIVKFCKE